MRGQTQTRTCRQMYRLINRKTERKMGGLTKTLIYRQMNRQTDEQMDRTIISQMVR